VEIIRSRALRAEIAKLGSSAIKSLRLLVFGLIIATLGCSRYYETKRPDYTDVSVVHKGTPRYDVTAALGKPVESYVKDGKQIDVFQVDPNGRYKGTKAAVDAFNGVADVLTIGMWEVVATPAELLTKHKLTTYVVTYSSDETVESITAVEELPKVASASDAPASGSAAAPTPIESPSSTSMATPLGSSVASPTASPPILHSGATPSAPTPTPSSTPSSSTTPSAPVPTVIPSSIAS
jgi:hypothetical protein